MSNKLYDRLKYVALVFVPAITGFVNVVLPVWGINDYLSTAIVTTLSAAGLALGAMLCITSKEYQNTIKELLDSPNALSVRSNNEDNEEE